MAFLYDQINGLNRDLDPRWLARLFDDEARIDPGTLTGWKTPTLLLCGEVDQLFPPAAIHEVAAILAGAKIVELPGVGHSTYFEAAAEFNDRVEAFVREHAS